MCEASWEINSSDSRVPFSFSPFYHWYSKKVHIFLSFIIESFCFFYFINEEYNLKQLLRMTTQSFALFQDLKKRGELPSWQNPWTNKWKPTQQRETQKQEQWTIWLIPHTRICFNWVVAFWFYIWPSTWCCNQGAKCLKSVGGQDETEKNQ